MKPTSLKSKENQSMSLEQIEEKVKTLLTRKNIHVKTLAHIEKIRDGFHHPLWAHVREKCQGLVRGTENLEDKADEYYPEVHHYPIPDRIIWKAQGLKKAAKIILAVEDMVNNEEGYRESLAKIEKEIKELGERKTKLSAGAK